MKSTRSISGWRYRVGLLVSMLLAMAACGEGDELGFSGSISLSANAVSATWITLSWSAPSGGVSVSPYVVARNDDQSGSSIGSTTSRTYEVAGLAPSTEYCFVIRNPLTGNTLSNKACATTLADTDAPSVPADLSVEPRSAAEIDLDWSLAGDNDRVDGYNIFRDGEFLATSQASRFTDATALPDTAYCYRVSAFDGAGNESAQGNEACISTPPDVEYPTVPTGLSATWSDNSGQSVISLTWTASTDDGRITHYRVYRNGAWHADVTGTRFEDADLASSSSYYYEVSAVDAAEKESGRSEKSVARESWKTLTLDATNALESAIVVDSNDNPHVAYKVKQYDSSTGKYPLQLRYTYLVTDRFPASQVLAEGEETYFFSDAYRLAMTITSNDVVNIAHKLNQSPYPEKIEHWQIQPASKISATVKESMNNMDSIALEIDSAGVMHACYSLSGTIYYATFDGSIWTSTSTESLAPGVSGNSCDIALGPNNSVHISYLNQSTTDLMYFSNESGTWRVERIDQHSGISISTSHRTTIAVDSTGNSHIAYFHDYADNDLEYATNVTGEWIMQKIESDGDVGYDCEIAIDSRDVLHVVYKDKTNGSLLKYAVNASGTWEKSTLAVAGIGGTSIAVDSLGSAHVMFTASGQVLTYISNRR